MASEKALVKEFPDLPQTGTSRFRVRVIRAGKNNAPVVDIREFVESSVFSGWTRRGIRLDANAFSTLMRQAQAIRKALKNPEAAATDL